MDGEAIPDLRGHFRAEDIGQRLAPMDVEVVHDQVDRFRFPVCHCQGDGDLGELKTRTIRRGEGKMKACLGFYDAENIGRPATLVFVIPSRLPSRRRRRGGPHVGMQRDWLLV